MASWQARCLAFAVRILMRRLTWGDERTMTRRARRVFGAPNPLQWLRTRDVRIDRVRGGRVFGEWIPGPERRTMRDVPSREHLGLRPDLLGDAWPQNPYASPVFGDLERLPPLLLQVASDELLVDDSRRVHDKVRKAGGISRLEVFDGVFHAWPMLDGFMPKARLALQQATAFVNDPTQPV